MAGVGTPLNPEEPARGPVAGGDAAGGDVAGGDAAGGDAAGGPVAGGDTAGGPVAGGFVAGGDGARGASRPSRPLIERAGMASIAAVIALLFGAVAVAAWYGGEGFLAVMSGSGALMTAWAGGNTLLRG
ncbi:MAG: hypothetical protein HYX57_06785 [Chloroflexi bacterium]|nr:hypothetical protein [Chloroflexota bacterium]